MKRYTIETIWANLYDGVIIDYPELKDIVKRSDDDRCYIEAESIDEVLDILAPIEEEKAHKIRFCVTPNKNEGWRIEIYDTWRE